MSKKNTLVIHKDFYEITGVMEQILERGIAEGTITENEGLEITDNFIKWIDNNNIHKILFTVKNS